MEIWLWMPETIEKPCSHGAKIFRSGVVAAELRYRVPLSKYCPQQKLWVLWKPGDTIMGVSTTLDDQEKPLRFGSHLWPKY